MMISPEGYYNHSLLGKDKKAIMTEIRSLKREINHLKDVLEYPLRDDIDFQMEPDPLTRICCMRAYLERAKEALSECGGVYTPTKAEIKAQTFSDNLDKISKLTFFIGGFIGTQHSRCLKFRDDKVEIKQEFNFVPGGFAPAPFDKNEFIDKLRELHIGEWKRSYDTRKSPIDICDGVQWRMSIEFSDGIRAVSFSGDNAYPYNFKELLELLDIDNDMGDDN